MWIRIAVVVATVVLTAWMLGAGPSYAEGIFKRAFVAGHFECDVSFDEDIIVLEQCVITDVEFD